MIVSVESNFLLTGYSLIKVLNSYNLGGVVPIICRSAGTGQEKQD